MTKPRRGLRLTREPIDERRLCQDVCLRNLDRYVVSESGVERTEHDAHDALTKHCLRMILPVEDNAYRRDFEATIFDMYRSVQQSRQQINPRRRVITLVRGDVETLETAASRTALATPTRAFRSRAQKLHFEALHWPPRRSPFQ